MQKMKKTKRKPRVSEAFGDFSKIHNKQGNGRQKHLKHGEGNFDLHDYFFE